jgi:hypothetical protein
MIQDPARLRVPGTADARGQDRPDHGDAERLADLATGGGHGRRHSRLRAGHAGDGGVRDRRVHHAEADTEDHVPGEEQRIAGLGGEGREGQGAGRHRRARDEQ